MPALPGAATSITARIRPIKPEAPPIRLPKTPALAYLKMGLSEAALARQHLGAAAPPTTRPNLVATTPIIANGVEYVTDLRTPIDQKLPMTLPPTQAGSTQPGGLVGSDGSFPWSRPGRASWERWLGAKRQSVDPTSTSNAATNASTGESPISAKTCERSRQTTTVNAFSPQRKMRTAKPASSRRFKSSPLLAWGAEGTHPRMRFAPPSASSKPAPEYGSSRTPTSVIARVFGASSTHKVGGAFGLVVVGPAPLGVPGAAHSAASCVLHTASVDPSRPRPVRGRVPKRTRWNGLCAGWRCGTRRAMYRAGGCKP